MMLGRERRGCEDDEDVWTTMMMTTMRPVIMLVIMLTMRTKMRATMRTNHDHNWITG